MAFALLQVHKKQVLSKTLEEKWLHARNFVTFWFKLACCPITDPDFRIGWLTWISVLFYLDDFGLLIYTLVIFRHDLLHCVETLYTFGVVAATPIQFYRIIHPMRYGYQSLVFFGGDYIYKNTKNPKFHGILNARALQLIRNVYVIAGLLCFGFFMFETFPVVTFLLTGKRTMVTSVQLPIFDPEGDWGYWINVINQTVLSHFIVFLNVGCDCTLAMIMNSMWAGVDIIQYSIDEMEMEFARNGDVLEQKFRLRNILIQIQDLDRLILRLTKLFDDKFLFQPILLAISIALAAFCIVITNAPPAYGYVLFAYFQLLYLCYLGNQVKVVNKAIAEALYGMSWYLFPIKQQKDIGHMLNRIQNGCRLTIGPLSELDNETATNITKKIYTYLMMLIRTAKK